MDIIKKIRPLKITYDHITIKTKLIIVGLLISLASLIVPHATQVKAQTDPDQLVFTIGDYEGYISDLTLQGKKQFTHEQVVRELKKQIELGDKLKEYLRERNSPLANHAHTLIQQNNWKKIIALSNAESSLCRRYPTDSANCWGVGGSNLWKMGSNLDEGIVSMNRFLNNYPLRSKIKYTQMSFEDMNGLYKQPARDHWVVNNMVVYNELSQLERGLLTYNN